MSEESAATTPQPSRKVHGRDIDATAPARCACYAAWSELTASPHDMDPRPGLREKFGAWQAVPHGKALDALVTEFVDTDLDALKRQYSGLFEVGSDGPPVPIREDLQTGQRAGTREDLVRFYDFFGYALAERFAWAPDHLSVELEFMHYLCYGEAAAEDDPEPYQLAQVDFAERHLVRWVPEFAAKSANAAGDGIYGRVMTALSDFILADYDWQSGTISAAEDN
ncbi:MAG: molecular chaperone TorD family protein [Chromatiales bacterium]|nr:MAG: molecular chaperone TorD family protein [Chromatiales bacterium]